jgi:adenylate cyclase
MFLARLLDDAIERRAEAQLATDLDRLFGIDVAVLVIDMADFTVDTASFGIAHELLTIRRMQLAATPIITAHAGRLVKADADNLFCLFPDVAQALAAALEIVAVTPSSAGIGFGRILDLGDDLFGDEVNRASKLGEDIAEHGEVLLSEAAKRRWVSPGT